MPTTRMTTCSLSFILLLAVGSSTAFAPTTTTTPTTTRTTCLDMSSSSSDHHGGLHNKDPERAHIEHSLEQAMDNDWRLFRAKLVAGEMAAGFSPSSTSSRNTFSHFQNTQSTTSSRNHADGNGVTPIRRSVFHSGSARHQEIVQQAQLRSKHLNQQASKLGGTMNTNTNNNNSGPAIGDLLGAAINSIFKGSSSSSSSNQQEQEQEQHEEFQGHHHHHHNLAFGHRQQSQEQSSDPATQLPSAFRRKHRENDDDEDGSASIFDGHSIGGASRSSSNSGYSSNSYSRTTSSYLDANTIETHDLLYQDPFCTEAELPLLLKPKTPYIDKHRWAHALSHIEPGCVLLANEKLGGVFHQSVVLIVEHDDTAGTFGVIINRPMEGDLLTIGTQQPSCKVDLSTKMAFSTSKVTYGGPVLADEFSILHSFGEVNGARKLCPGVYIGGSQELISQVRLNRFSPQNALFCKGHAAWVPDQLNKEINKGVWYIAAASPDLILRYAGAPHSKIDDPHPNDLWTDIMLCMQGEYADIAERFGGGAGDVGRGRLMP